jgi:hypothetical protein
MAVSQRVFIQESELNNYQRQHKGAKYQLASTNRKRKIRSNIIPFKAVEYQFSKIKERSISTKSLVLRLAETGFYPEWQQSTAQKETVKTVQYADNPVVKGDAWDVLEAMIGTIEALSNWSSEHDYYLYGTPKHQPETIE